MKLAPTILLAGLLGAGAALANSVTVTIVNISPCWPVTVTVVAGIAEGGAGAFNVYNAPGGIFTLAGGETRQVVCTAVSLGPTVAAAAFVNGTAHDPSLPFYVGSTVPCPLGSDTNQPAMPPATTNHPVYGKLVWIMARAKLPDGTWTNQPVLIKVKAKP